MSLLPKPFTVGNVVSPLLPSPAFLLNDGLSPKNASHFPPWYSGSKSSQLHQVLSQNRTVPLGVPALWTPKETEDNSLTPLPFAQPWRTSQGQRGNGQTFNNFNQFQNGTTGRKSHYCDVCDRNFFTQAELHNHLAMHIMCSINGCKFQAHPKIVALHKKMQHATGLAEKIMNLDTPEDIRKWREERRKNFPSVENVERKKKEQEARVERGEVVENKFFGKMRQNQPGYQNGEESTPQQQQRHQRGRRRGRNNRGRSWGARRSAGMQGVLETNYSPVNQTKPLATSETGAVLSATAKPESVTLKPESIILKVDEDWNGKLRRFRGTLFSYDLEEVVEKQPPEVVVNGHKRRRRGRKNNISLVKQKSENACSDGECDSKVARLDTDDVSIGPTTELVFDVADKPCNLSIEELTNMPLCNQSSSIVQEKNFVDDSELEYSKLKLSTLKESALEPVPKSESSSCSNGQSQISRTVSESTVEPIELQDSTVNNHEFNLETTSDNHKLNEIISDDDEEHFEVVRPNTYFKESTDNNAKPTSPRKDEFEDGELPSSDEETEIVKKVAPLHFFIANPQGDSDDERKCPDGPAEIPVQRVGGSLSLLAGYGTDSDSGVEEEKVTLAMDVPKESHAPKMPPAPKASLAPKAASVRKRPIPDMYPLHRSQQKGKKRISLLEKLLADEIRHERNVILQCVHHTVKNNFYDSK